MTNSERPRSDKSGAAFASDRVTANTVKQVDAVLESFTGASLSDLVGRLLENGNRGNAKPNGDSPNKPSGSPKGGVNHSAGGSTNASSGRF